MKILHYILMSIYWPILILVSLISGSISIYIFKEVGFDKPYKWICIAALIAVIIDKIIQFNIKKNN